MKGVVDVWATWATFQPKLEKYKKIRNIHSEKISCSFPKSKKFSYFGKSNFLALRLKKFYIFLKKAFLIFQEMELFKKASCISGENFPSSKN